MLVISTQKVRNPKLRSAENIQIDCARNLRLVHTCLLRSALKIRDAASVVLAPKARVTRKCHQWIHWNLPEMHRESCGERWTSACEERWTPKRVKNVFNTNAVNISHMLKQK